MRLPLTDADVAAWGPYWLRGGGGAGLRVQLSTDIAGATRKWTGRLVRLDASPVRERSTFGTVEVANPFDVADGDMPWRLDCSLQLMSRGARSLMYWRCRGLRAGGRVFIER